MADRPPIVNPDTTEKERPPIVSPDMSIATVERPLIKDERPPLRLPMPTREAKWDEFSKGANMDEAKAGEYEDAMLNTMAFDIPAEETFRSRDAINTSMSRSPDATLKKDSTRNLYNYVSALGPDVESKNSNAKMGGFLNGVKVINKLSRIMGDAVLNAWIGGSNELAVSTATGLEIVGAELQARTGFDEAAAEEARTQAFARGDPFASLIQAEPRRIREARKGAGEFLEERGAAGREFFQEQAAKFAPPESIAGKNVVDNPELLIDPIFYLDGITRMTPAFIGAMATGLGAGRTVKVGGDALKITPQVVNRLAQVTTAVVGGFSGGTMEGAGDYNQAIAMGKSPQDAREAYYRMTVASSALNALSINLLLNKVPAETKGKVLTWLTSGKLGQAATGFVTEGTTEGIEEIFSSFNLTGEMGDSWKDAITVALLAGPSGAGTALVTGRQAQPEKPLEDAIREAGIKNVLPEDRAPDAFPNIPPKAPQAQRETFESVAEQLSREDITEDEAISLLDKVLNPIKDEEGAVTIDTRDTVTISDEQFDLADPVQREKAIDRGLELFRETGEIDTNSAVAQEIIDAKLLLDELGPEGTAETVLDTRKRIETEKRKQPRPAPKTLLELIETDEITREREIASGIERFRETGEINLQSPVVLDVIKGHILNEAYTVRDNFTDILDIGRSVIAEGKVKLDEFSTRMQEVLGEAWEKVKPYLKTAWDVLNNEVGAVGRAQTETPEFKRWFKNSKVVDDNGEPLVVHHGGFGIDKIDAFEEIFGGQTTGNNEAGAFHFVDNLEVAEDYGRQSFIRRFQDAPEELLDEKIIESAPEGIDFDVTGDAYDFVEELAEENIETQSVYLAMENPIILDMEGETVDVQQIERISKFVKTGIDETGEFEEYYEQRFGDIDPSLIEENRAEIEERARENFGLEEDEEIETYMFDESAQEVLEEFGHGPEETPIDGVIIKNMVDDIGAQSRQIADQYIAFEPTQIKSATENVGAFDPTVANIRGEIDLNAEISLAPIIERLQKFADNPEQGAKDMMTLANSVWAEGKTQVKDFMARMKEVLGDLFESLKPHAQKAWNILANERGAIEFGSEGAPEINLEDRVQAIRTQARSKELPAFMEDNPTWSEEEVDTALDKAQQGKPITEREAEIVHAALAEAGANFYQEAIEDEFITLEPDEINAIIEQGIQDFVSKLEVVKPVVLTAEQKKKKDRTKEFARRGKEIANLQDTLKETAYLLHQSVQDQASVRQESKVDTKAAKEAVRRLESKIATRDKQVATLREKTRIAALNIPKPLKPKAQIREATGQVKSPELRDLARSLLRQEGVARAAEREGRKDEAVKVRTRIKDQMERARGKTDETADRNKLRDQIKKMLKTTKPKTEGGKPVGKFTPEVQRSLDKLREAANLDIDQAEARIQENLAKYSDQLPPDEIALENRVLSMVHGIGFYGKIYSNELAQIRDELREMIDEGRMMNELKKFNREAQVEKWVAEAVHVLTGGKGLPEGASAKTRKANYDRIQGLTDRTKQWFASTGKTIVGFDDVMDILSGLDPSTPFESELNKLTDVMEAESAEKRGIKKALTRMQDMYMEAFGIEAEQGEGIIGKALSDRKKTKLMIEQMQADAQQIDLGTFTDLMGRRTPLEISRSEARKRYMELKDPSLADTFTEGMGYTNEMKQAILGTLTTRDRAFADAQLEFLQEYYDSINEVYRDLYGVDLPKNEFYNPIIREGFGRDASKGFGVMLEEINLRPSVTPSGAKSRTPNILPISDIGDISILQRHMAEMEHFKAWAQRTKDLRAIFDNSEVRAAIELFHDPKLLGVIENFMAKFMRGGVDTSQNMDTLDKWRVNMARSVLAIKPAIGIKQLTSFVAYADAMPVTEFAKYSAKFWMNPIENAKTLYANSTVLSERGAHMERDIRDAQNTDEYKAFRLSPSFMNTLMLNIKMGDQGAIVMGGWPLYQYTLDQGATQEEAIRVFEKVTSGTQQSADLSQLSVWQSGNSFAKLFTTYKSSPNQYFRKELGALRNLMRGRQGVKKTAKTIFIFHMLLPMLFQFVSDGFEIDEEEQLRAIVLGPLNGVFIAGDIMEQIIRAALGQRQFDSEIPMMSIGDDAAKAMSALTSDDISSEDFLRATRALAGVAGHVTGVPAKTAIDMGTGVVDTLSGDYEKGAYEVLGWSPYKAKKAAGETKKTKRRR